MPDDGVELTQQPPHQSPGRHDSEASSQRSNADPDGPSLGLIKRRHLAHGLGLAHLESAAQDTSQRQQGSRCVSELPCKT